MSSPIIGKKFQSVEEVHKFITDFEKKNFICLYKRDSKKLNCISQKRRCPNACETADQHLKYATITYACTKGGRKFKSRSQGIRQCSTFREDCPMKICVKLSNDGKNLEISKHIEEHNHEINRESFPLLPKERRLDENTKKEVIKLKHLRCNKALLQNYIQEKTGKKLLLRDITNIRCNTGDSDNTNSLSKISEILQNEKEYVIRYMVNEENVLEGIYFQSRLMRMVFEHYPEIMLLDATYKLNNLGMPLYVLMTINGNNEGDPVAIFLLQNETTENINTMIGYFKESNALWTNTKVILTDKDFKERNVIRGQFVNCKLLLCLFHTLKSFRTNITVEKMGITSAQRDIVLNILQDMAYSKTQEEYDKQFMKLKELNHHHVLNYFEKNWHNTKEEWVEYFKKQSGANRVYTTNHLESFNKKIKTVCSKFNKLHTFFSEFLVLIKSHFSEKEAKAFILFSKCKAQYSYIHEDEKKYAKHLTPFAFQLVSKNINKLHNTTVTGNYLSELNDVCTCSFFKEMNLPCVHILKFRQDKGQSLFIEDIPNRFKKSFYLKCYAANIAEEDFITMTDKNPCGDINVTTVINQRKNRILSCQEKFKKCMIKCQKLSEVMADLGTKDFDYCFKKLENFVENVAMKNFHNENVSNLCSESDNIEMYSKIQGLTGNTSENMPINIEFIDMPIEITSEVESYTFMNIESSDVSEINKIDEEKRIVETPTNLETNDTQMKNSSQTETYTYSVIERAHIDIADNVEIFSESQNKTDTVRIRDDNVGTKYTEFNEIQLNAETENTCNIPHIQIKKNDRCDILIDERKETGNISSEIENIKIPAPVKRCGRPRGYATTVVGLKKNTTKCTKFTQFHPIRRRKIILLAILQDQEIINKVLSGQLINQEMISQVTTVDCMLLEEEVVLEEVEEYFTSGAFILLKKFIAEKKITAKYYCGICNFIILEDSQASVRCDSCLKWMHKKCTALTKMPKLKSWFCGGCKK